MLTRPKASLTVVSAPTISKVTDRRTSCSAQTLSLPLDQAMRVRGGLAISDYRAFVFGCGAGR
jgi:hypothetical protein